MCEGGGMMHIRIRRIHTPTAALSCIQMQRSKRDYYFPRCAKEKSVNGDKTLKTVMFRQDLLPKTIMVFIDAFVSSDLRSLN